MCKCTLQVPEATTKVACVDKDAVALGRACPTCKKKSSKWMPKIDFGAVACSGSTVMLCVGDASLRSQSARAG